jgi:hypothetical protein
MRQVRMQSEGKLPPGAPRKYPSAFAAYGIIARWAGCAAPEQRFRRSGLHRPAVVRASSQG